MWLGKSGESWGEQAWRSTQEMSASAGKDWAVAAGQGRCGRSCERLEMHTPRIPVSFPSCPFCVCHLDCLRGPLSLGPLSEITWARDAFFGNGYFSQAPKATQNPQNYNRTVRRLPGNRKTKAGWEEQ